MRKFFSPIFIVAASFVFIFSNVPSVKAQDTGDYEFTLEEITVTAQKREENQQKVAIPMEVFLGRDLAETGKNDVDEIFAQVAGIVINRAEDGLRISIHGISNDNDAERGEVQTATPTAAVNKDGVYSNQNSAGDTLFDIERVEVLMGPQSTLYASATPGGVVNVVTATPKLDQFSANGLFEYGNYNLLHTEGAMNAPLSDTVALRAAFTTSVHDGYISNGMDDEDVKSGRIRALWQPNERFSFLLTGEIKKSNDYGIGSVDDFVNQDEKSDPWYSSEENTGNSLRQTTKKAYSNIDMDFGLFTSSLVLSVNKLSSGGTSTSADADGTDLVTSTSSHEVSEKSAEARFLSSEDFPFKWILGFIYYKSTDEMHSKDDSGGYNDKDAEQTTKAVYGNITYPVTDVFRVTGGIRYTNDKNDSLAVSYPDMDGGIRYEISDMPYSHPDYKIGIEYDVSETMMAYADWSTSYRIQLNAYDQEGNQLPPEQLDAYTVGAKSRFLGNKLQLNTSAYYYDYHNYFAVTGAEYVNFKDLDGDGLYTGENLYDPDTGNYRDEAYIDNDDNGKQVGECYIYGVDITSNWIITNKDKLDLSIAYMKTKFTDLFFDFMDLTNEQGSPDLDYSGKERPQSPHWVISAAYSHNFNLPNGGIITPKIEARYRSSYTMTWKAEQLTLDDDTYELVVIDLSKKRLQESYTLYNFSTVYADPEGKWTLSAYVDNITNYADKRNWFVRGGGVGKMIIGKPRTYGAVFSVRY